MLKLTPRNWLIAWALATSIAALFTIQAYFFGLYADQPINIVSRFLFEAINLYIWLGSLPLLLAIYRRFPLALTPSMAWGVHTGAGVILGLAQRYALLGIYFMIYPPNVPSPWITLNAKSLGGWVNGFFSYATLIAAFHGIDFYLAYRREQLRAGQLRAELAESTLQALRAQLHPHFLFNTLHAINSLMEENVHAAQAMVASLSDLLRYVLDQQHRTLIPLKEELAFIQKYLSIEAIRFQDRLQVIYDIERDSETKNVPSLILQPIVENAIKHGLQHIQGPGQVRITASTSDSQLILTVQDNGPGLHEQRSEGLGIRNTRERLGHAYGDRAQLRISSYSPKGTRVEIRIPL